MKPDEADEDADAIIDELLGRSKGGSSKSERRRVKYLMRLNATSAWRICECNLWLYRSRLAKRGFGPEQLRGKGPLALVRILYPEE